MCSPSKKKLKPNGLDILPPVSKPYSYSYSPCLGIFSAPTPVPVPSSSSQSHAHAHERYNNACNNVNNSYNVPNHPQSQLIGIGNGKGIVIENESFLRKYEEEIKKVNDEKEDDNAYFNSFPPGFRFVPTDQELFLHYLKKKMDNEQLPKNRIHDVNISDYNPETLAENYPPFGDKIWYFFTPRVRKYVNGTRPKRAAGKGYWRATGKDKLIYDEKEIVGKKRALVFYEGKPPKGDKTNWIMHEYRIGDPREKTSEDDMRLDDNVLCRIYKKNKPMKDSQQQDIAEEENKENNNDNNNNYVQSQTVEDQGIHNNPPVNNTPVIAAIAADALPPVPLTTGPIMTTIIPSAVPPPTVNSLYDQYPLYNSHYTYQESPIMTVPNNLYEQSPMMSTPDNLYDEYLCPNPLGLDLCWASIIPNKSTTESPSSVVSEEKTIF